MRIILSEAENLLSWLFGIANGQTNYHGAHGLGELFSVARRTPMASVGFYDSCERHATIAWRAELAEAIHKFIPAR